MAVPKKFQNAYTKATIDGITYKVGDEVRSLGSLGYIRNVSATAAWVIFRDYEAEVAWQDLTLASKPSVRAKSSAKTSAKSSAKTAAKPQITHAAGTHTTETRTVEHEQCLDLLAKERAITEAERLRVSALEAEVEVLRAQNGRLQSDCKEDPGDGASISPGGNLVETSDSDTDKQSENIDSTGTSHERRFNEQSEQEEKVRYTSQAGCTFSTAGGKESTILKSITAQEPVLVVAPRDLSYDEIDFNINVKVVYPVSRSLKWVASDAWKRGYRDSEYSIYQVIPKQKLVRSYSIDRNQTLERIHRVTKPATEPIATSLSTNCRVEIVRIGARDTVRIIFGAAPGPVVTRQLKSAGFRYYHERGTDLHYWGSFFSSEKLRFAKQLCGSGDTSQTETQDLPTQSNPAPEHGPELELEPDVSTEDVPLEQSEDEQVERPEDTQVMETEEAQDYNTTASDDDLDRADSALSSIESLLREALKK